MRPSLALAALLLAAAAAAAAGDRAPCEFGCLSRPFPRARCRECAPCYSQDDYEDADLAAAQRQLGRAQRQAARAEANIERAQQSVERAQQGGGRECWQDRFGRWYCEGGPRNGGDGGGDDTFIISGKRIIADTLEKALTIFRSGR